MKYRKSLILRDGTLCILRNATADDAEEVMNNFLITHSETDYLTTYLDEKFFDIETERQLLHEKEASANMIEMCACIDGHIVGTAGIEAVGTRYKLCHRAEFGIGIEKNFWRKGIGRALSEACVECAGHAGYLQLELEVVSGNVPAISLYQSIGFQEYGRNPRGFRSRFAGWQEIVLMRMELDGINVK